MSGEREWGGGSAGFTGQAQDTTEKRYRLGAGQLPVRSLEASLGRRQCAET